MTQDNEMEQDQTPKANEAAPEPRVIFTDFASI